MSSAEPLSTAAGREAPVPGSSGRTGRRRLPAWFTPGAVAAALLVLGAVLRAVQYAWNRSLWLDEALIALNLRNRSIGEMLTPLDFAQGGPAAWLVLERLSVGLVGDDGYGLRLVPLVLGLASLPAIYAVARAHLAGWSATLAIGLFAISPTLIYYSSEAKQYAGDVLVSLLILLVAARVATRGISPVGATALAAVGSAAVWLSHPSVFMLAGVGAVLSVDAARRRNVPELMRLAVAGSAWVASFVVVYLVNIRDISEVRALATGGDNGPSTPLDVAWLSRATNSTVGFALGLPRGAVGLGVLLAALGVVGFVTRRRHLQLALLLAPAAIVLGAAAVDLYSVGQRFSLFLAPAVVLMVASGVGELARLVGPRGRLVPLLAAAVLLAEPTAVALKGLVEPQRREDIRPVLEQVAAAREPGEPILMSYDAQFAFAIHGPEAGIPVALADWDADPPSGEDFERAIEPVPPIYVEEPDGGSILDDARRLPPGRAWVVLARDAVEEEGPFVVDELERRGRLIDHVRATEVEAWRFDLRAR